MISSQAVIDSSARIGKNVEIYPFAYIEKDVEIGDNCIIYPYVSIMQGTKMGTNNHVYQNSVLGAVPQDFSYEGDATELIIGNHNIIRENVVINRATKKGDQTVIGNENFLMEGVHISHDSVVGNNCVFGYGAKIAGNCDIRDNVILSSGVIANPETRVGKGAMVQSGCRFSKDVPPYIVAAHMPIEYGGINSKVLSGYGIDEEVQRDIANAYRLIFHSEGRLFDIINQVKEQVSMGKEIQTIIDFLQETQLGIISKKRI